MVINEKIHEKNIKNIFKYENCASSNETIFFSPYNETAASVGIDNRKEIFAASNLSKFNNLAAVITIPDLLTPGTREMI